MRLAPVATLATAGWLLAMPSAEAANADYQAFFFRVCGTASGTLAARCDETPGGLGNLSGDSESSLNPSQNLSHNLSPIGTAQTRSKAARERGERLRDEGPSVEAPAARVDSGPFSLLVNVHGTWFDREVADDRERGFDGDSAAAEIGLDYRISDRAVLGAVLGIERLQYDFDAEAPGVNFTPAPVAGDVDVHNTYLTLFASFALGESGFIEAAGGFEQSDGDYRRNSVFQESTRTLPQTEVRVAGNADGTTAWASVNAGYDFHHGAASFGPYAGVTWTRAELDPYTEQDLNDSGLAMSFGGTARKSTLVHAGLRASRAFGTGAGVLVPQLRVEYQRELEDDAPTAVSRFALDPAGTQYGLTGGTGDDDAINAGLSLAAILPNGWMVFADWAILLDNDAIDRQRATFGLRKEF
jgi:outer membrane autotransporter protein